MEVSSDCRLFLYKKKDQPLELVLCILKNRCRSLVLPLEKSNFQDECMRRNPRIGYDTANVLCIMQITIFVLNIRQQLSHRFLLAALCTARHFLNYIIQCMQKKVKTSTIVQQNRRPLGHRLRKTKKGQTIRQDALASRKAAAGVEPACFQETRSLLFSAPLPPKFFFFLFLITLCHGFASSANFCRVFCG